MKLTTAELRAAFKEARAKVPVGTRWSHYRGGQYEIVGHGFNANLEVVEAEYYRFDGPGYEDDESDMPFHRDVAEWGDTHEGEQKWTSLT